MTTVDPFEDRFREAAGSAPDAPARERRLPPAIGGGTGLPPVDTDPEAVRGSEVAPSIMPESDTHPFFTDPYGLRPKAFEPYRRGEEWEPERWPMEDVIALQRNLDALGLLEPPYRLGRWDTKSASAYSELLGFANQIGGKDVPFTDVVTQYGEMELVEPEDEAGAAGRQAFIPRTYREPSAAQVASELRNMWKQRLGREIRPEEEAEFSQAFMQHSRAAFNADEQVRRSEFNAAQDALAEETGIPSDVLDGWLGQMRTEDTTDGAVAPVEGPAQIDPAAEIDAMFEERFGPEMRENVRAEELFDGRRNLRQSIAAMASGTNPNSVPGG